jgi:hypothetical protein
MAVYDRCGEQILTFLEEAGVPLDDFFYTNVLDCSLHTDDPVRTTTRMLECSNLL